MTTNTSTLSENSCDTVGELIDQLQLCDPAALVVLPNTNAVRVHLTRVQPAIWWSDSRRKYLQGSVSTRTESEVHNIVTLEYSQKGYAASTLRKVYNEVALEDNAVDPTTAEEWLATIVNELKCDKSDASTTQIPMEIARRNHRWNQSFYCFPDAGKYFTFKQLNAGAFDKQLPSNVNELFVRHALSPLVLISTVTYEAFARAMYCDHVAALLSERRWSEIEAPAAKISSPINALTDWLCPKNGCNRFNDKRSIYCGNCGVMKKK